MYFNNDKQDKLLMASALSFIMAIEENEATTIEEIKALSNIVARSFELTPDAVSAFYDKTIHEVFQ